MYILLIPVPVPSSIIRENPTLAAILATDRRLCLSDSIYRMTHEQGANRLLRLAMLEHASGLMFDNYPLNDTAEFIRLVSVPVLDAYLYNLRKSMNQPEKYPIEKANDMKKQLKVFRSRFMDLPAQPFEAVADKRHPADILSNWLKQYPI